MKTLSTILLSLLLCNSVFGQGVLVPTFDDLPEAYDDTELRTRIEAIEAAIRKLAEDISPPENPGEPPVDPPEEPEEPEPPLPPDDHSHDIHLHHATFPDFSAHPTHSVKQHCLWSELEGLTEDSVVLIEEGVTVVMDIDTHVKTIGIKGQLVFEPAVHVTLTVQEILVYKEGYLEIGTEDAPITGQVEIVFGDKPLKMDHGQGVKDPSQYGNGLLVLGKVRMHGRPLNNTFIRLPTNPAAGEALPSLPGDWQEGDLVVVPDTRQIPRTVKEPRFFSQSEEFRVGDGKLFEFDHLGPFTPHAANVTRNIILRSENVDTVMRRGHTMFTDQADIDIRYVQFDGLGRTAPTIRPMIDATTFNDDGTVKKEAQNHIGRYAVHFHHVRGPENPDNTGYQGRIKGCSFTRWQLWAISIHESHYMEVTDNVYYAGMGNNIGVYNDQSASAIVTETGGESFNRIANNFVCHSRTKSEQQIFGAHGYSIGGQYGKITDTARNGIWLSGTNNEVVGNVLTNCPDWGIVYQGHGTGGVKHVPKFRGADVMDKDQRLELKNMPILRCEDNEIYGAVGDGFWIAYHGNNKERSVVSGLRIWHTTRAGIYDWGQTPNMTYENLELVGDPNIVDDPSLINHGMEFGDTYYHNEGLLVKDCVVRGFGIGVKLPHRGQKKLLQFDNLQLDNYIDVQYNPPRFESDLKLSMNSIQFGPLATPREDYPQPCKVWCELFQGEPHTMILNKTSLEVNGSKIYFYEQAPDFVIPPHRTQRGAIRDDLPAVGLTNEEAKVQLGVSIGGEIAPTDAVDGAGCDILGLVK